MIPDRLWMRVPLHLKRHPEADKWLRSKAEKVATQSSGRLLEGPPLRVEDPISAMYDCVTYAYPAERPNFLRLTT